jgi:hypothetical protein
VGGGLWMLGILDLQYVAHGYKWKVIKDKDCRKLQ